MENVSSICNEIKTIVSDADGTALVKLVAVLIATGVTKTAELAELIGVTPRAIQLAKKRTPVREPEFAHANVDSPKCERGFAKTQAEQSPPIRNLPSVDSYPYYFEKNGSLVVDDQVKAKWRPRFDSDEQFELAVEQAGGWLVTGPVHIARFNAQMAYHLSHRKPLHSTPKAAPYGQVVPYRPRPQPKPMSRETFEIMQRAGLA